MTKSEANDMQPAQSDIPREDSPITDDVLNAFNANTFTLECPQITLVKNATSFPETITGRGFISLVESAFELRMFADAGTDGLREFMRQSAWVPGTLVPDSEFYGMIATDSNGIRWQSEKILLKRHGINRDVLCARFELLTHRSQCKRSASSATTYWFEQFEVPYNRYVEKTSKLGDETNETITLAATDVDTGDFRIRARPLDVGPNILQIILDFNGSCRPDVGVEYRILEALRFALFRPVSWSICVLEKDELREVTLLPRRKLQSYLLHAPICKPEFHARDFWHLFSAYLKHVLSFSDPKCYSPLASQLHALINAETHELRVISLLVSVAVEGVLNLEFTNVAEPSTTFCKAVDEAKKDIERWPNLDPGLRKRMLGAMDPMKRARTSDKIRSLVENGLLTADMEKAWRALRNAAAHATVDLRPSDTQSLWTKCLTVATMLNVLVFKTVQYTGHYTDYSAHGWPTKPVPHPLGTCDP